MHEGAFKIENGSEHFPVKEGIDFVFEQNPQLANAVYKTLGFEKQIQDQKIFYDELNKLSLPTAPDDFYDTKILKSKASNYETLYISKKLYELAYKNDEINQTRPGGAQTLDRIIARGGYTLEEFSKLLPDARRYLPEYKTIYEKLATVKLEQEQQARQVYSQYLDSIFPGTKIAAIGNKGVSENFVEEDKPSFYTFDIDAAKYYSSLQEGSRVINAVFNFKNPLIVNAEKPSPIPIVEINGNVLGTFTDKDINEKIQNVGYDGLVLNRRFGTPLDGWEVLSFDKTSRHILGTEEDIEKFKEFVK